MCGPTIWNKFPQDLRSTRAREQLKRRRKLQQPNRVDRARGTTSLPWSRPFVIANEQQRCVLKCTRHQSTSDIGRENSPTSSVQFVISAASEKYHKMSASQRTVWHMEHISLSSYISNSPVFDPHGILTFPVVLAFAILRNRHVQSMNVVIPSAVVSTFRSYCRQYNSSFHSQLWMLFHQSVA